MLVLGKKRTCFLIQSIDYKNPNDFKKIIEQIEKFDNVVQYDHHQGRLIYLKSNLNYVSMILSSNPTCQKKLGFYYLILVIITNGLILSLVFVLKIQTDSELYYLQIGVEN